MNQRDPRYDILFEPVQIGPLTARNRFYQVPHCNGMGYMRPNTLAAMRGIKAEGGWAVVCTEEVEIHANSDNGSAAEGRLWDDGDIPALAKMTEAVHEHGALAGIELVHGGYSSANNYSRIPPLAPSAISVNSYDPVQARAMNKADIRDFRKWHRQAALRAKQAEFDLVYVYAGHSLTLLMHFLSRRFNHRTDEYGGSLENRVRLFREVLEDTKDAVGHRCAVAVRFAVDELLGPKGITSENEGREVVEMLAEIPDLWDVNISEWENDSATSRFEKEGYQEPYIDFVKSLTTKPVVGVGRYTSPDTMVSLIKRGVMDMIGAARPSIADPFLPKKIEEGRVDLRSWRLAVSTNAMYSKSNDGRRMASRLASGKDRASRKRRWCTGGGRRSCRIRMRSSTGQTWLPGDSRRRVRRTWRTGQPGKQTSRIGRVGTCEGSSGGHAREIEKRDPLPRQLAQQGRHF